MARKQFKLRVNICRNEDGSLISNQQEILDRWVTHFNKWLNRSKGNECVTFTTISSNQISQGKTQDTIDAPTTEEIKRALKKLNNNKAPGTNNIPAEILKFGHDRLKRWLKYTFSSIWINDEIPEESGLKVLYVHCIRTAISWNVLTIEASIS